MPLSSHELYELTSPDTESLITISVSQITSFVLHSNKLFSIRVRFLFVLPVHMRNKGFCVVSEVEYN